MYAYAAAGNGPPHYAPPPSYLPAHHPAHGVPTGMPPGLPPPPQEPPPQQQPQPQHYSKRRRFVPFKKTTK